jgi:hypothetical protein
LGTFGETARDDYRLSFGDQGKENFIFCFRCSKQTEVCRFRFSVGSGFPVCACVGVGVRVVCVCVYIYIYTYIYVYIFMPPFQTKTEVCRLSVC